MLNGMKLVAIRAKISQQTAFLNDFGNYLKKGQMQTVNLFDWEGMDGKINTREAFKMLQFVEINFLCFTRYHKLPNVSVES